MGSLRRLLTTFLPAALLLLLCGAGIFGCKSCPRCDPSSLEDAPPQETACYPLVEKPAADSLAASLGALAAAPPAGTRSLQVLALSGGVAGAPFTAGVLGGWTETGTRPTFDVVTGISSGALIGAYAFLGPKYDPEMRRLILTLNTDDLMRFRPLRCMLRDGAFGSAEPAERLIRRVYCDSFVDDLRRAHAEGRRLFVGTMSMQTKRLVIWDIGAIASSDRPDSGDLVRKVLLAAISWPGAVPPVEFDVEVNGRRYHEQHCDAGPVAMAFVRFGPQSGWPECNIARPGWLAGSDLYVLASRKLYSDPEQVARCAIPRLGLSVTTLFEALTRADIARLFSFCGVAGMRFHLLAVPPEYHGEPPCITNLYPKEARQLFEVGYERGLRGPCWRVSPPGAEPGEEAVPRDGSGVSACH